ncbi:hypothetical protein LX32DRAFT_339563 [Colletotrichum zoysiae]|uniref:Uncharacterized protein n=1 Tax=Colletotrichum zoysiae TaxID=1216348 RepID=A0AAD9HVK5_9PEZI|nr:hypothetical protein LX32DRAFT_339563 [Colletotrichum zoysiae]
MHSHTQHTHTHTHELLGFLSPFTMTKHEKAQSDLRLVGKQRKASLDIRKLWPVPYPYRILLVFLFDFFFSFSLRSYRQQASSPLAGGIHAVWKGPDERADGSNH